MTRPSIGYYQTVTEVYASTGGWTGQDADYNYYWVEYYWPDTKGWDSMLVFLTKGQWK